MKVLKFSSGASSCCLLRQGYNKDYEGTNLFIASRRALNCLLTTSSYINCDILLSTSSYNMETIKI
jgi:hypothetical protein